MQETKTMLSEFVSPGDISRPIVVILPSQGNGEMGNGPTIRENIKEDTHNHPTGLKHSMSFHRQTNFVPRQAL
jgi:hypothetical protein